MERRLGRGLGSLLSSAEPTEDKTEIALDSIRPNPFQPRQTFEPTALEELKASLLEHGLLQPIVVRQQPDGAGYELVSGERRVRAARMAGWQRIRATVRPDVDDRTLLELALVENVQRRDLDPIEKARGYQRLIQELGLSQEEVAKRVGLRRSTVTNHLRLLELEEPIQEAVAQGLASMGHARALLGLPGTPARLGLLEEIARDELSVREVERRVREKTRPGARPAERTARVARPEKPPWALELEARLRESLGTKASLENGEGYRGRIVLEYYGRSDLERLLEQLAPAAKI